MKWFAEVYGTRRLLVVNCVFMFWSVILILTAEAVRINIAGHYTFSPPFNRSAC